MIIMYNIWLLPLKDNPHTVHTGTGALIFLIPVLYQLPFNFCKAQNFTKHANKQMLKPATSDTSDPIWSDRCT